MKELIINRLKKVFKHYDINSFLFGIYIMTTASYIIYSSLISGLIFGLYYPAFCFLLSKLLGEKVRT